ncbi:ATP-dependent RNA helicase HrpA [Coraliomargarita parva]|uniref:ATP-dependent RNA helicase HrpA n=1 Tax=Coraliomargarita parva TaxID=3014050 RepID=UPI0022B358E2|nr:ATP-dependent RNA helicase HrpA [Coraliomargarita parva]
MPTKPQLHPTYSGDLPIHARREEIIRTVRDNPVVVIAGETGSGKTTQLPKYLIECGLGQERLIGCTQPRRVAALSVAQRIAEELKVNFGKEVGAKIRFTDKTGADTSIKVMTDGILLNELQDDPLLSAYEAIVIDEAHERSLNIDFILGCLRQILKQRSDLKVIITSATIDTERFSKAFDDAPIIEVSGRMYPVDTLYRPIEDIGEEAEDLNYIEAAAEIVREILDENQIGDILVFLPGERDIHELRRLLEDSPARHCDLLPLYGRLANADQQRIFHPGGRRRVILATNIAETSLTVPGIRYVVDTGLARISRYSPHSHTLRLPIEPVAQSSADQRKGRCGRVSNGVCYRLYSEQDYLSRPRFTTPEIHRSNLATVILRMLAFRLGDIRSFPFIEPPTENAIRGGFRLLSELGAVRGIKDDTPDPSFRVTGLGRKLAQLPVDPTVGRMLLQAEREGASEDVCVIAAALSIQDPRERPSEKTKEADEMQKRFIHPESDFLSLLNIWNSYHDELERLSQSQLRKFCKTHFLSYQRMREWRDIHQQLSRILKDLRPRKSREQSLHPATTNNGQQTTNNYPAIHRSILTGLLSNIATKEAGHDYRGPRNRKAMLFPGSGLFDHETAKKIRKAAYAKKGKSAPSKTSAPDWIVCGEWMETSRLYARTAAKIEVQWVEELAADLIQVSHSEPFWSEKQAAALCKQRKLLFGLEIDRRNVSFTQVDAETATDIFVRCGLVEEGIKEEPDFLKHNRSLREEAESELVRRRLGSSAVVEDRLFDFYRQRLRACGSYAELRRFAKKQYGGPLDFLKARLDDLLPSADADDTDLEFPKAVAIGGVSLPLNYRNEPGSEADGVTLQVPIAQLDALREGTLDWAVPGHIEAKIESLLRGLPKPIRVALHPLKERAAELRKQVRPSEESLRDQLAALLKRDFGIQTYKDEWARTELPDHLKPRIQIQNTSGESLAAGRDLDALKASLSQQANKASKGEGLSSIPAWQAAAGRIEKENLQDWTFGDLPESIDLSGEAGLPLKAYPALVLENEQVHLRLLPDRASALKASAVAWPRLGEIVLGRELAWMQRDLKDLKQLGALLLPLGNADTVRPAAWAHLRRHLFRTTQVLPLSAGRFEAACKQADTERRGILMQLMDRLRALLSEQQTASLILEKKRTSKALSYPGMRAQLDQLVPASLLDEYEFDELPHLTRFLKAMILRAERAKENIQRDMDKAKRVAPFEAQLKQLEKKLGTASAKPYRMLLEEFKVSVYAQELGTAQKVSEKRLEKLAGELTR